MSGPFDSTRAEPRPPRVAIIAVACLALVGAASPMVSAPTPAVAAAKPHLSIAPIRVGSREAPVVLSVSAPRSSDLKLRVNGHAVADPLEFAGRRLHVAGLSTGDGLVPGTNRLHVRAVTRSGTATTGRRVRVPRSALFADAGRDTGTTVNAISQVGVAPEGPGATNGLHRKWRIVEQPDGADVTLRHRHAAQPLLQPTTTGTYVLRLRARLPGTHRTSYDRVTVPVSPDDPPIGAPFNSIDPDTGAITIGGDSCGASTDTTRIAYAVLERTTRKPVECDSVPNDDAGIAKLAGFADTYGKGDNLLNYLMIVSGRGGVAAAQQASFSKLAQALGAPLFPPGDFTALGAEPFSIVGIPGAAAGAASYRIPSRTGVEQSGAMTGYLEKNQAVDS